MNDQDLVESVDGSLSSSRMPFLNSTALRPKFRINDGRRALPNNSIAMTKKIKSSVVPIPNMGLLWVGRVDREEATKTGSRAPSYLIGSPWSVKRSNSA